MKIAHAGPQAVRDRLREQRRRHRAAARSLESAFPQVQVIRLDLQFAESTVAAPVPQVHVLHPPASAFFDYPCPHSDCDGHFDLTSAVTGSIDAGRSRCAGMTDCSGERVKDSRGRQRCGLRIDYLVSIEYR